MAGQKSVTETSTKSIPLIRCHNFKASVSSDKIPGFGFTFATQTTSRCVEEHEELLTLPFIFRTQHDEVPKFTVRRG